MISAAGMCAIMAGFLSASERTDGVVVADGLRGRAVCYPIEVFTREDCDQCARAEQFMAALARKCPDVRVAQFDVSKDRQALKRLHELCRQHRVETVGVPGVLAGNQLFVGYKDDATTGKRIEESLTIEVFTRHGCPHCAKAKEFLGDLSRRYPGLRVVVSDVVQDRVALARMHELARRYRVQVPSLPMISIFGRAIVGYREHESTGRELEKLVAAATIRCSAGDGTGSERSAELQPTKGASAAGPGQMGLVPGGWGIGTRAMGAATAVVFGPEDDVRDVVQEGIPERLEEPLAEPGEPPEAGGSAEPPDELEVPMFGTLRVSDLGMPVFTFLVGLVDGFNPCAMWVLIFLLSVLVNLKDRRRIIAIAGTFVFVSGLAYFSFMAAWLNVFVLIGFARWAQVALGTLAIVIGVVNVKDFAAFGRGVSFSIPESAKPGIYARVRQIVSARYMTGALIGAVVLAVLVNTIELLCTAGIPALYTEILTFQQYAWWKNYAYLALYIVAYMFDDTIMLTVAVVTLSHRKLQEREGRRLKLMSGLVILGLGLLMLFKPEWLI